jgi:adenine deaminase
MSDPIERLIRGIPKAELHCHIEGTLEPEMMFALAQRNKIQLPYASVEEIRVKYNFANLQSFLDLYYQGMSVLQTEQDFFDLTWAYLNKAKQNCIVHTEIFFDPQAHTARGVSFSTVITGIDRALQQGERELGISHRLILCFLRDHSEEDAMATFKTALPYQDKIIAVGLDSAEMGNPPSKFARVFAAAEKAGFMAIAHAGEEGPPEYMWEAIKILHVKRIDHGVRCIEDPILVDYLKTHQLPLTVCPLSNIKLQVFKKIQDHDLKTLLRKGLCVNINSDDPAYFDGYVVDNYLAVYRALELTQEDIIQLTKNGFRASFISENEKTAYLNSIDDFVEQEKNNV